MTLSSVFLPHRVNDGLLLHSLLEFISLRIPWVVPFQERERSPYSGEEEFFLSCFHAAHTPFQAKKAAFLSTRVSQVFVMIGRQFSPAETVH